MRPPRFLLLAIVAHATPWFFANLAPLPAQTSRCEASGPITAYVNFNLLDSIPAGPLATPRTASVYESGVRATTTITPSAAGVRWAADVIDSSPSGFGMVSPQNALAPLLLRISGDVPGIVTVSATGSRVGFGTNSLGVDIGADYNSEVAVTDLQGPLQQQFRVCIQGELRIRIWLSVTSGGWQSSSHGDGASLDAAITFTPLVPAAEVQAYGATCGPLLDASDTPTGLVHELRFTLLPSAVPDLALCVLGSGRTLLPIPGTACRLRTVPLITLPFHDAGNQLRLRVPVPGPLHGFRLHAQAFTVDSTGGLRSSNGVEVRFDDC